MMFDSIVLLFWGFLIFPNSKTLQKNTLIRSIQYGRGRKNNLNRDRFDWIGEHGDLGEKFV